MDRLARAPSLKIRTEHLRRVAAGRSNPGNMFIVTLFF
jgi:hypothetical protein